MRFDETMSSEPRELQTQAQSTSLSRQVLKSTQSRIREEMLRHLESDPGSSLSRTAKVMAVAQALLLLSCVTLSRSTDLLVPRYQPPLTGLLVCEKRMWGEKTSRSDS